MSLAILFHFLCAQHVSDINISIIRSLRLCCWITTLVVLFVVRCVLEIWLDQISKTHRTKNKTTDVVIQEHSCQLLMMDILMSETCWAYEKWNKIASDIKLVFYSSTITVMHGPINISENISYNFALFIHWLLHLQDKGRRVQWIQFIRWIRAWPDKVPECQAAHTET